MSGVALVEPAAQPNPGAAAALGAHVASLAALTAADHVPAGQGVGADEDAWHHAPAGQPLQTALSIGAHEPAAHGAHAVTDTEFAGETVPLGQSAGAEAPAGQYAPPRHGVGDDAPGGQ